MAARKHSLTAALVAALGLAAGPAAGSAAASVFLCVPASAGAAVTSRGSAGACASGTPVELPDSRADQHTLVSILPYLSFNATGIAGEPTITFKGANVQLVNGLGSTGTINGAGTSSSATTRTRARRPARTASSPARGTRSTASARS
jgi:hypothetical protein